MTQLPLIHITTLAFNVLLFFSPAIAPYKKGKKKKAAKLSSPIWDLSSSHDLKQEEKSTCLMFCSSIFCFFFFCVTLRYTPFHLCFLRFLCQCSYICVCVCMRLAIPHYTPSFLTDEGTRGQFSLLGSQSELVERGVALCTRYKKEKKREEGTEREGGANAHSSDVGKWVACQGCARQLAGSPGFQLTRCPPTFFYS